MTAPRIRLHKHKLFSKDTSPSVILSFQCEPHFGNYPKKTFEPQRRKERNGKPFLNFFVPFASLRLLTAGFGIIHLAESNIAINAQKNKTKSSPAPVRPGRYRPYRGNGRGEDIEEVARYHDFRAWSKVVLLFRAAGDDSGICALPEDMRKGFCF